MNFIAMRKGARVAAVVAASAAVVSLAFVQTPSAQSVRAPAIEGPVSFADVVETVSPAVVNIAVEKVSRTSFSGQRFRGMPEGAPLEEFFGRFFEMPGGPAMPQERRSQGLGSGFIVSADGYVVTNNHVIDSADDVVVILEGGESLQAEVIGVDARTDLAVLKVEHDADLPYVEFGDSDNTRVGEWVLAIGNPFGLGGSATAGIVSARGRDIRSGPYDDYLQIDAPINSGNSGGPVFNGAGQVVGVNTAIFSPNGGNIGIGFAIPATQAQPIVAALMRDGSVERGWLGVQIQDLDEDLAAVLGADDENGAVVGEVDRTGPAAAAGIEAGDVIRSVDGNAIEGSRELSRVIAGRDPGDRVSITVLRDGRERDFDVRLGDLDNGPVTARAERSSDDSNALAGLSLGELRAADRSRLGLPADVDGVLVRQVAPGSAAAEKGIRPGDVITSIDRSEVASVDDARAALQSAEDGRALLVLRRGDSQRFVALPAG